MPEATSSTSSSLEHIDLSNPDTIDISQAAQQLLKATEKCGFVYVRINASHSSTIESVRRVQRAFFSQPASVKNTLAIDTNNRGYLAPGMAQMHGATRKDQKEVFFWGREAADDDVDVIAGLPLCGANQWPEMDGFHDAVTAYSELVGEIGNKLLQIIAVALGAKQDFFEDYYQRSMLRGQLLCYPPTEDHPDQFGVAPHSDFGCITLLLQETAGLEVLFPGGEWVLAPPEENTLVVNIGDLLERWSNMRMPSTKHRVRNLSNDQRYSIAMFYDPNPDAVIDSSLLLPKDASKFPPVQAAEYILGRNKGAFAHFKS